MNSSELVTALDDISASFCGKYSLTVTKDCLESLKSSEKIYVTWSFDKKNIKKENDRFCLNEILVRVLVDRLTEHQVEGDNIETMVTGYTRATITTTEGEKIILYAHPCFQGTSRYD